MKKLVIPRSACQAKTPARASSRAGRSGRSGPGRRGPAPPGGTSASRASARRRRPRVPVSVCVSKWSEPERPAAARDRAERRLGDRVVAAEHDRDRARVDDLPDRLLDRRVGASGSAGITGASPKSTARSSRSASTPASRCGPRRAARRPDRARPVPRPGPVGDEVVRRRADDRDVHALELGRILGVREAAEGEQARVVRLVAEVAPAPERVDHLSIFPRPARIEAWNATLPSSEAARAATRPRSAQRSSARARSASRRSRSSAARACASAASRRRRGCRPPSR